MSPSSRRAPALAAVSRHFLPIAAVTVAAAILGALLASAEPARFRATAELQVTAPAAHPRLVELGLLPDESAPEAAQSLARLAAATIPDGVRVTSEQARVVVTAEAGTPAGAAAEAKAGAAALLAERNEEYGRTRAGAEARVTQQLSEQKARFDAPETAVLEQAVADLLALAGSTDPSVRAGVPVEPVEIGSPPARWLWGFVAGLAAFLLSAAVVVGSGTLRGARLSLPRLRGLAAHRLVGRAARPRLALAGAVAASLRLGAERGSLSLGPAPAGDDEPDEGASEEQGALSAELAAVRELEERLLALQAEAADWTEAVPELPPPAVEVAAPPTPAKSRAHRHVRRLSVVLMLAGVLLLSYAATIVVWRDPVTDIYARWQQHRLEAKLAQSFRDYGVAAPSDDEPAVPRNPTRPPSAAELASSRRSVAAAARRVGAGLERSDPLGRIVIPKLGIDPVFVHGTRWSSDLSKGPGHYEQTALPGLGKTVAIAGHRTTFGAPFRHINRLVTRDEIVLETVYATFHYRVVSHEIVDDDDWTIIRPRRLETLVLSACHPLFRASHRWIVYARLAEVVPTRGVPYRIGSDGRPLASGLASG